MSYQLNKILGNFLLITTITSNAYTQNIPERYRKTVVFLSTINQLGETNYLGTGFFIAVLEPNAVFGYLVTAKHVILGPGGKIPFQFIDILFNKKDNQRDSLRLNINGSGRRRGVYFHSDTSVDLAVIPLLIDVDSSDVRYCLESELFKSKKDFDTSYIKPGSNLFYTGMFSPYLGYNKNYPITRFGKVSLITDEKIQFEKTEPRANLFLAETTTFGGNSGSPVFAYGSEYKINSYDQSDPINSKEQNHVPIYLCGIIKGYFEENTPIDFKNTSTMTPTYTSNVGITAIIPSYLLYEILESPNLKNIRNAILLNNKDKK